MLSWNIKTRGRMHCVLVEEGTQWPLFVCGLSKVVLASLQSQRLFSLLPAALELPLLPALQPEPYQQNRAFYQEVCQSRVCCTVHANLQKSVDQYMSDCTGLILCYSNNALTLTVTKITFMISFRISMPHHNILCG